MAVAIMVLAAVAGCSGGSLTQSDQVIVRLIGVDVDGARPIAQAECNRRNGEARFLTVVGSASGAPGYDNPEPPSAVFACDHGH